MFVLLRRAVCTLTCALLLVQASYAAEWGLWYGNGAGKLPEGTHSLAELRPYNAYFADDTGDKVLYLTFDCGYENGYTAPILDTLKKHHAPATFFVLGHYLDTAPDLTKRMLAEGHFVANHTSSHPAMMSVGKSRFTTELASLETQFATLTGQTLAPFYRPPSGEYTLTQLNWAKALGYHTIFWSVAYADWDTNNQPSRESALKTLRSRVHPGAIVLLHTVSRTNAQIFDELLTGWEREGYRFAALSALPYLPHPTTSAIPSTISVCVGNQCVQPTAFLIENSNFVKLRDLAQIFSGTDKAFSVSYDRQTLRVQIERGQAYAAVGGELAGPADVAAIQVQPRTQTLWLDGQARDLPCFTIDGTHYVGLRAFADALELPLSYDAATRTVKFTLVSDAPSTQSNVGQTVPQATTPV